ncbi:Sec-independent protein translocase subunit TatA [Corynebacterium aquatimens]|uniref:Sec-independent protein translocase protein TatA n=1 Tax=Corynebacterium aquatimens TaxID=1190508 RepID=A0A931E0N2_9CORY|nr:Sec-independent protein translocase subunit TatA [Corynebacterium aquatimens]MBG6121581.1 sec-independent protein translocase protein TatA [Corynebacterium aquatimens]WJY65879.1 Sec-independent protein translocase protein TatAd [Corynebacterium aquatimens]
MPNLGPTELILILLVILLLFGASKLPDLARSMGRSARIFKSEIKEMENDDKAHDAGQAANTAPAVNGEPRQLPAGGSASNQAQSAAEQGFWDRPENQPRRTN